VTRLKQGFKDDIVACTLCRLSREWMEHVIATIETPVVIARSIVYLWENETQIVVLLRNGQVERRKK
jgi:hypothetical protein